MFNFTAVPLFSHVVLTTAKAFIVLCNVFFCCLLISVRIVCYLLCITAGSTSPSSLIKFMAPKRLCLIAGSVYTNHSAPVGHADLFFERCTGTSWVAFLIQRNPNTQSHNIHFACKFGDMNTNKLDSCLSAVIHNSLF